MAVPVSPPPCRSVGAQCQALKVTLRVAELDDDDRQFHDAIATWLLGHDERITFGKPYVSGRRLLVDATIHIPCRYLETGTPGGSRRQDGAVRCRAHGFRGRLPATRRPPRATLQHGNGDCTIVQDRRPSRLSLAATVQPARALPVVDVVNPCAGAPCRTADHRQGAACCRDLIIEVVSPAHDDRQFALLRSRRSPYLCKVEQEEPDIVECEVISACGYLEGDGITCALHDRVRPDGSLAKPPVCREWPNPGPDDAWHPGCRLMEQRTP